MARHQTNRNAWLASLQAGDSVAIRSMRNPDYFRVENVLAVTRSTIIVGFDGFIPFSFPTKTGIKIFNDAVDVDSLVIEPFDEDYANLFIEQDQITKETYSIAEGGLYHGYWNEKKQQRNTK